MGIQEARNRVILADLCPHVDEGRFAIKRIVGDEVIVEVDAFCDGHDLIACKLCFKNEKDEGWKELFMQPIGNDRYQGAFTCETLGTYYYTVHAWVDHFKTWQADIKKKKAAGVEYSQDFQTGLELIQVALLDEAKEITSPEDENLAKRMSDLYPNKKWVTKHQIYSCQVEPRLAGFSAWYELFPRSASFKPNSHGTLLDVINLLDSIAAMGFDVLYLPPIHPIGSSFRKGKNNSLHAASGDYGSPWAIGSKDGGHKAIHPLLGTISDFEELVKEAKKRNIYIAMDIAFQCSPDHPYLNEHPEWFSHRPDGSIKHAENPPKKYEDIIPFNFETVAYKELWHELASILFFWIEKGITVFRVDNPHTKPLRFWQWLIAEVKRKFPQVIFLSEAFTRPKVMHHLAKVGFSQSYTYFTWRYTKGEMTRFIQELIQKNVSEYFRPNLWTNTPDILPKICSMIQRQAL